MKNNKKNRKDFLANKQANLHISEEKNMFAYIPEEKFEYWGGLVYSKATSDLITVAISNHNKIYKN